MTRHIFAWLIPVALCAIASSPSLLVAQQGDTSRFPFNDKVVLDQCLAVLRAHPELFAYVTHDTVKKRVLRFSAKPLPRPYGRHPENPPAMRDMSLELFGRPPSRQAIKFLESQVVAHNKQLRGKPKQAPAADKKPAPSRDALPPPRGVPAPTRASKPTTKPAPARPATATPGTAKVAAVSKPASPPSDLDVLLNLLGQRGAVNNEPVGFAPLDGTTGEWWIGKLEKLRTSVPAPAKKRKKKGKKKRPATTKSSAAGGSREVAEAVKRLQPAIDALQVVVEDEKKTSELIHKLRTERGPDAPDLSLVLETSRYTDEQIQYWLRRGEIDEAKAAELREIRSAALGSYLRRLSKLMAATMKARLELKARNRPLIPMIELLRHAVVRDVLLPALRARSGPKQERPPLELQISAVPRGGIHYGARRAYLTVQSHSPVELTQLTLLLKIETTAGDRYAAMYLPKLPPGGNIRFEPLPLSAAALSGDPAYVGGRPELTNVRYAAWCSQFRTEGQEVTIVPVPEMVTNSWLQAVQPGLVYVSRGGTKPQMSAKEIVEARRRDPTWRLEPEQPRRFEVVFKKLTPGKKAYSVELDLVDHQAKDKVDRFRGTFELPPVTLGKLGEVLHPLESRRFGEVGRDEEETLILKLRSRTEEMELRLLGWWDSMERHWSSRRGPALARRLVPEHEIPAADSPEGIARAQLAAAMKLAQDGKFEEARRGLEKVVADHPGTSLEAAAKLSLSKLEIMKQAREKAAESRKRSPR